MPDPDGATYHNHSGDDLRLWGAPSLIVTVKFSWLIDLIMIKTSEEQGQGLISVFIDIL